MGPMAGRSGASTPWFGDCRRGDRL